MTEPSSVTKVKARALARHVVKETLKQKGIKISSVTLRELNAATDELMRVLGDKFIAEAERINKIYDELNAKLN